MNHQVDFHAFNHQLLDFTKPQRSRQMDWLSFGFIREQFPFFEDYETFCEKIVENNISLQQTQYIPTPEDLNVLKEYDSQSPDFSMDEQDNNRGIRRQYFQKTKQHRIRKAGLEKNKKRYQKVKSQDDLLRDFIEREQKNQERQDQKDFEEYKRNTDNETSESYFINLNEQSCEEMEKIYIRNGIFFR